MSLNLKPGNLVLVQSFALGKKDLVKVKLLKRVTSSGGMGTDGWDALLYDANDVLKLIKKGVPYKKDEKPTVWVFDYHIVKKIRARRRTKNCKSKSKSLK